MILLQLYFILSLSLGTIPNAISQPNSGNITNLNVDNGLEGLQVEDFIIDQKEQLWIKTEKGVNVFDSTLVNYYKFGEGPHDIHSHNELAFFVEKNDDILMFYQNEGLFYDRWNRSSQTFEKINIGFSDLNQYEFHSWIKDKNEDVWIYREKDKKSILFQEQTGFKIQFELETKIQSIIAGKEVFWILTKNNNLYSLRKNGILKHYPLKASLISNQSFEDQERHIFHEDKLGRVWISYKAKKGLFVLHPNKEKITPFEQQNRLYSFTNVWEDEKGTLLFGCSKRQKYVLAYYLLESTAKELIPWHYLEENDRIPVIIRSKDFYNDLFMGTHRGMRVFRFRKDFVQNVLHNPSIKEGNYGETIFSISELNDSTLIAMEEGKNCYLINTLNDEIIDTLTLDIGENFHFVNCVYDDSLNKLWFHIHTGTKHSSGLMSYNITNETYRLHDIKFKISSLLLDENNLLLLAGYDKKQKMIVSFPEPYVQTNILVSISDSTNKKNRIRTMKLDLKNNRIWFGKDNEGLYYYDRENNSYSATNFKKSIAINHINQRENGRILLSTMNGLYDVETNGDVKYKLGKKQGLNNTSVCYSIETKNKKLWATTFSGLYNYTSPNIYGNISIQDGLGFSEFNQRSGKLAKNGKLYAGGANGLLAFDINAYLKNRRNISINYIHLKDDQKDITLPHIDTLYVLHQQEKLSLDIKMLHSKWSIDDDFRYLYKIDDRPWNTNSNNILHFNHFSNGIHRISIKGVSRTGLVSTNELHLSVKVYQKTWETTWFQVLCWAIGLLVIVFFIFKYFENKRIYKKEIAFERAQKMASFELEALRSQLNPHFVFNAMGAIQSYIGQNDKREAQVYLADFSKLMRMFLESSKTKLTMLDQELDMLKLYIKLELLRFDNSFNYNIKIDDIINSDKYLVPSLLLQPFIENAINHGLAHRQEIGTLLLLITKTEDEKLSIIIEDNGIGRKKSNEMNSKLLYKSKSRGMELVNNRIELLSKTQDIQVDIEYTDLYNVIGDSAGLRVEIRLPIIYN